MSRAMAQKSGGMVSVRKSESLPNVNVVDAPVLGTAVFDRPVDAIPMEKSQGGAV